MYVEPFGVDSAFTPRDDMRGPQESLIRDPCKRAMPLQVVHQAVAKDVLPDPLHNQPFGLRRARQICGAPLELAQWRIGQADAQLVNAV